MITLITALIFFIIGRLSYTTRARERQTIDSIVQKSREIPKKKLKPGIIPFKTQEELELERNGDKALDDEWRRSGKGELFNETL